MSSAFLVEELLRQLGEPRAVEILGIALGRLASIRAGRGRLSENQLDRITVITGRPYTLWSLDAGDRAGREGRDPTGITQHGDILREMYEASAAAEVARAKARMAPGSKQSTAVHGGVKSRRRKPAA